eukprot:415870-Rhodomonas_salina.2
MGRGQAAGGGCEGGAREDHLCGEPLCKLTERDDVVASNMVVEHFRQQDLGDGEAAWRIGEKQTISAER